MVYHVLNRANARATIFESDADYAAFQRVLCEALARSPGMRLLAYCLMPNHWHLVLWPAADGQLSQFMRWLTMTHTQRWHAHRHTAGNGHLYQGRFKCFAVQQDEHFLIACRYVERNALRAGLVARAEHWRWCSLWRRAAIGANTDENPAMRAPPLSPWPVDRPADWLAVVNQPQTPAEEHAVCRAILRSRPFGADAWVDETVARLGLQWTVRPRGGQRKAPESSNANSF